MAKRKAKGKQETVRAVTASTVPLMRWTPTVGPELTSLLDYLPIPPASKSSLRSETVGVLGKCLSPQELEGRYTGLVVGYVQSGKTMSFTAVTALARDNNYQMVILIGGTSRYLFQQSEDRLKRDLRLNARNDWKWQHFSNPSVSGDTVQKIAGTLQDWKDPSVPTSERQTVVITVMKNRTRLDNLNGVLTGLGARLQSAPALIIDDEADQAGLNTLAWQRRLGINDGSAIYSRLLGLRQLLPHHTFLQYTATPQAPLLINLIDMLSPRFVEVLSPGPDFIGGQHFFLGQQGLVRTIPPNEIPSADNELAEPPDSLLEAMRLFFLGVAAEYAKPEVRGNRSMMVHPSYKIVKHDEYHRWVNAVKNSWETTLALPNSDPDKKELLREFCGAYRELRRTVPDLPAFDRLVGSLPRAIRKTHVTPVNSVSTAKVEWRSTYPHVLVGGQAMDRGFTVEGLTVTYMPRGIGVGQADTIQQRARFFGYKRPYFNMCRVFLEPTVRDAYRRYVEHEEDIRGRLIELRDSGTPLPEWRRAFFLTTALKPTRRCVLDLAYLHGRWSDAWFYPASPHYSKDAIQSNHQAVESFLGNLTLRQDPGDRRRTPEQRHLFSARVPLDTAFKDLLVQLCFQRPEDNQAMTGILLQIKAYLEENPRATCAVYRMSPSHTRLRGLDSDDAVDQLFQGAHPSKPKERQGEIYPGDRDIRARNALTIQIHYLNLHRKGKQIASNIPTIALWVPAEMARAWLVQERASSAP